MLEAEEAIKDWFAVREVARRNSSLVVRASRFLAAEECWDRFDAAALEQVSRHPAILSKIADDLHISEADVAFKVRHKAQNIRRTCTLSCDSPESWTVASSVTAASTATHRRSWTT
ncbi:hypothetical protein MTO96_033087 [Rhipicephalus appendiculatus]